MNNQDLFDCDFFIKYFERIPEDQWCIGVFQNDRGQHCALGHCGVTATHYGTMGAALDRLFRDDFGFSPIIVNDGALSPFFGKPTPPFFGQPTPKARILAALCQIKAKQLPTPPALMLQPAWPTVAMQVKPVEGVMV